MNRHALARALLAVALGTFSGLWFGPVFGGVPGPRAFLLAVAAVGVVSAAIVSAVAMFPRLPAFVAALTGATAVGLAAMVSSGTYADIRHGPKHLLTLALPTEAAGPALATVALIAGWSTLAAGLIAVYTTNPLAPLPPIFICLLAALSLGASSRPIPVWYPLAAVVLVVLVLLAGRSAFPSPAAISLAVLTAAIAVSASAVVGPAAPGLGNRPPADLRDLVASPVTPRSGVSPLQQYLALRNGGRPIKITGTVSRPGTLLRMATLTRFDRGYWTVDGDYRRAGTALPEPRLSGARTTVNQQITVDAGELDWLVTAGRATAVSVGGLGVDEATGDLAIPVDVTPPAGYTATSTVGQADIDEILATDPAPAPDRLTNLPPQLSSFLATAVAGQPEGSDQLLALYRRFTGDKQPDGEERFKYDQSADAPGGHGYYQIQRLLETKRGTSEQYASAYAVLCRHLGYDSRVVMGFRPRYQADRAGTFVVTGQDVDAWVEVNFTGIGWVSIDPSPRDNPEGMRPNAPPAPIQRSTADDPLKAADRTPQPVPPETTEDDGEEGTAAPTLLGRSAAFGTIVALAALLIGIVIPVAKAARRMRRRRARSDRLAVIGAWQDTLDRLREAGIRIDATRTKADVIRAVGNIHAHLVQPASLPALALVADRAAYAPEAPPQTMRAQAWIIAAELRVMVRKTMRPARRLRALLDPRPLLRRE